ncbi:hypothetical protein KGQ31_03515, partial [Patescibacteria group bacterium]|nr:hypothetical protein [Patescibacteria group bacterium]
MSTQQLEIFSSHGRLTERERLMRAFADGDKLSKALDLYEKDLMVALRKAGGNSNDPCVKRLVQFGSTFLGDGCGLV